MHLKEIESFFGITVYINSYLNGKTILQVKDASLARVLDLCTCLTNFGLLESHLCTGTPTENGKRPETRKFERYFAFMYTAIYKNSSFYSFEFKDQRVTSFTLNRSCILCQTFPWSSGDRDCHPGRSGTRWGTRRPAPSSSGCTCSMI